MLPVVLNPNLLSSSDSSNGGSCEQLKIGEEQFQVVVGSSGAGKSSSNGNTTASKTTESTTVPITGGGLRPAVGAILATDNTLSEETCALMTSSISTKYSLYPPLVLFNYGMFGAQGSAGATAWEAYLQEPTRTTQFLLHYLKSFLTPVVALPQITPRSQKRMTRMSLPMWRKTGPSQTRATFFDYRVGFDYFTPFLQLRAVPLVVPALGGKPAAPRSPTIQRNFGVP